MKKLKYLIGYTKPDFVQKIMLPILARNKRKIEGFSNLPACMLQVEDEIYTLFDCEYYTDVRSTKELE